MPFATAKPPGNTDFRGFQKKKRGETQRVRSVKHKKAPTNTNEQYYPSLPQFAASPIRIEFLSKLHFPVRAAMHCSLKSTNVAYHEAKYTATERKKAMYRAYDNSWDICTN